MEPENNLSPNALLEIENRQYNEKPTFYTTPRRHCLVCRTRCSGCSTRCTAATPQTQAQMSAGWCLPKQTLNSAVRGMVEQGLVMLTPAPGCRHGKNLSLTGAGRALAEKTVARVIRAEKCAMQRMGLLERARQNLALGAEYLHFLQEEFTQLKESQNKTENV